MPQVPIAWVDVAHDTVPRGTAPFTRNRHKGVGSQAVVHVWPVRALGNARLGRCMMVISKAFRAPVRSLLPRRACGCFGLYDGRRRAELVGRLALLLDL